jgi:hypothetical protein
MCWCGETHTISCSKSETTLATSYMISKIMLYSIIFEIVMFTRKHYLDAHFLDFAAKKERE